jgi:DNA-directed RNA polymerase specialized sigma24 family protein
MSELSLSGLQQKKNWTLTPPALERLLAWLDEGTNSDGLRYLEMRRRLVSYFDRKNCATLDELADETLNRVARRLEEEELIESETPARYCYIVARFVFLEYLRSLRKDDELFNDQLTPASAVVPSPEIGDEREARERMLNCLEQCTSSLQPLSREIITRYYVGTGRKKIENRTALAREFGISMNALSIRACRIRDKLETCVRQCAVGDLK